MTSETRDDEQIGGTDVEHTTRSVEFDSETDSVVETIATAVADLAGESPTTIDPIYEVVDPDALETLLHSIGTRPTPSEVTLTFGYHGYTVTVHGYGLVEVTEAAA